MRHARNLLALALGGALPFLLSGCIFAAVHAVRYVARQANPPQPVLRGSAEFFASGLRATLWVRPAARRSWDSPAAEPEEPPADAVAAPTDPEAPKPRMVLWTVIQNSGAATIEFTVLSSRSVLGVRAESKAYALAPGQRAVLDPVRAVREANLDRLEVALSLQRGDAVENRTIVLLPLAKAR